MFNKISGFVTICALLFILKPSVGYTCVAPNKSGTCDDPDQVPKEVVVTIKKTTTNGNSTSKEGGVTVGVPAHGLIQVGGNASGSNTVSGGTTETIITQEKMILCARPEQSCTPDERKKAAAQKAAAQKAAAQKAAAQKAAAQKAAAQKAAAQKAAAQKAAAQKAAASRGGGGGGGGYEPGGGGGYEPGGGGGGVNDFINNLERRCVTTHTSVNDRSGTTVFQPKTDCFLAPR